MLRARDRVASRRSVPAHARTHYSRLRAQQQQDNREAADRLLAHGEQLLKDWKHPDPVVREQARRSCRRRRRSFAAAARAHSQTLPAVARALQPPHSLIPLARTPTHPPTPAPYYVGGTAFSRNPPMPEGIKVVLDFGREEGTY